MISRRVLGIVFGLTAVILPLAAAVQAQETSAQHTPARSAHNQGTDTRKIGQYHSEGERIFAQNCSRCHHAPDGFSPRISGTVVRHMRVRAQLSEHDEQELLRFFNP